MLKIILEILRLALPAVGEMTLYMLIWIFDTSMVGKHSGSVGVSAVGLSSEIIYTCFNILVAMGISVGVTSLVSNAMGARNIEKAKRISNVALKLSIVLGILLSLGVFFLAPAIFKLVSNENDIIILGSRYARICTLGITFNMITNVINGMFRGCKNTKIPLYSACIMNIVNLSLDYVLIFGKFGFPELGVRGAAIATVTGIFCAFLFSVSQLKKLPFKVSLKEKNDKERRKELLNLSIPSGCQEAAFSINRLINTSIIMGLGGVAFSANQITITIESMSFMPGWGLSIALTSLVGHSFGEKRYDKAKTYISYTLLLSVVFMGLVSIVFFFWPEFLITLFMKKEEQEVIHLGAMCLFLAGLEQIPMAIAMTLEGAMKGMGDTKTPFKVVLFTNWIIRMPLMYYFLAYKKSEVTMFWKITAIQWTLEAIIIFIVFEYLWKKRFKNFENKS